MSKKLKSFISITTLLALGFLSIHPVKAQAIDLTQFVAGAGFQAHDLSTGERVSFSGQGSCPGGLSPVRQFKNANYEQFCIGGSGIYRQEDTSWAPLPGFQDALCAVDNQKAIYTLVPGCGYTYSEGQTVTGDGAWWAPASSSVGQVWSTPAHTIVTIKDTLRTGGAKLYCSTSNAFGYPACIGDGANRGVIAEYFPPGSFTFCTGITNVADVIAISGGGSAAGGGDRFYYMRGWGLVGFYAPGFAAGLMGSGANPAGCANWTPGLPVPTIVPPGSAPGGPIPPPYVECQDTNLTIGYPTEFHTYRPYQASPCNLAVEPARLYCGNDFIVQQTFTVKPVNAIEPCVDNGNTITCLFRQSSGTIQLSVNLDDAELPIMGNTQLVPNQPNQGNPPVENLAYNKRTGEYVSWYLNGPIHNFEEGKTIFPKTAIEKEKFITTYAGPLNKLLPLQIALLRRKRQVNRAGNSRHDQIVNCSDKTTFFEECDLPVLPPSSAVRVSDMGGPLDISLLRTIAPLQFPGTANTYPFVPLSSTENRVGTVEAYRGIDQQNPTNGIIPYNPPQPPSGAINMIIKDQNVGFANSPPGWDYDQIYLAHLEENRDLTEILQDTYLPQGVPVQFEEKANELYYNTFSCDLTNVRWNSGDDVFGELDVPTPDISGLYNYVAEFQCTFTKPCFPPGSNTNCGETECRAACIADRAIYCQNEENLCLADPASYGCGTDPAIAVVCCQAVETNCNNTSGCIGTCSYKACNAIAASAPFSVYTRSPRLDEIWGRTVAAPQSIFKRIYPQITAVTADVPTMAFEILDLPGVSTAHYRSVGTDVTAHAATIYRPGERADIFFPHLGGIYEYFLIGIREALLPYSGRQSRRPAATRNPPAVLPEACNWDPVISSCHYYVPGTACYVDPNDTSANPIGICPDIQNGWPIPVVVNGQLCGDPVCESGKCNPYEYNPPNDYIDHCPAQPDPCWVNCKLINQTSWDPPEYDDPLFNGCYYANADVCVRKDAARFGDARCAATCNRLCCR